MAENCALAVDAELLLENSGRQIARTYSSVGPGLRLQPQFSGIESIPREIQGLGSSHVTGDTEFTDATAQVGYRQTRSSPRLFGVGFSDLPAEFGERLIDLELHQCGGRRRRAEHAATAIDADDLETLGGQRLDQHCATDAEPYHKHVARDVSRQLSRRYAGSAVGLPDRNAGPQVELARHRGRQGTRENMNPGE